MATDVGKVFEAELENVFRLLDDQYLMAWHRFPDTHSAGGSGIQPQPSDYLLGLPEGSKVPGHFGGQRGIFFEAKASEKHRTLQKSAVRAEQRGFIHRYCGLLHLPYLVCHYSTLTGNIQMWDGRAVSEAGAGNRLVAKHLLVEFPAGSGRKLNKDKCASAFQQFFSLPDKLKTVKLYNQF